MVPDDKIVGDPDRCPHCTSKDTNSADNASVFVRHVTTRRAQKTIRVILNTGIFVFLWPNLHLVRSLLPSSPFS